MWRRIRDAAVRHAPWVVVAAAFLARLIYIFQADASPLFAHPVVDGKTYTEQAVRLAAGNWLGVGEGPYWQPPLYPWFLGFVLGASADSFFYAVRVVQAVLGTLTCWMVFDLGSRLFRREVGLVAGLVAALYGPFLFFDGELLPATLATFLDLWGLRLLLSALDEPAPRRFLKAGAVLGLAALTVPTVLTFVGAAAVWVAWAARRSGRPWPDALRRAGLFAAGAALVIAPVTLRNAVVGGDAVLISWNGGVNYYLGNNPEYEATVAVRPGWEWTDLVTRPDAEGVTRPSEKSRWFFDQGARYATSDPPGWAALQLRKTREFWQGAEEGRNQPIYYWRSYAPILAITMWKAGVAFPFGLLAPLALVGIALALRRRETHVPLLFVVVYSASVIAFFPAARYRLPVVPVLIVFAAWAGFALIEAWREGRRRRAGALAAGALVLAVALNVGGGAMDMEGNADVHFNLGDAYLRSGRLDEAERAFRHVLELDPDYLEARFTLGTVQGMRGNLGGALATLQEVSRQDPERAEVWLNLATLYLQMAQADAAERAFRRALDIDPKNEDAYARLLTLFAQAGDDAGARETLDRIGVELPERAAYFDDLYRRLVERVRQGPVQGRS